MQDVEHAEIWPGGVHVRLQHWTPAPDSAMARFNELFPDSCWHIGRAAFDVHEIPFGFPVDFQIVEFQNAWGDQGAITTNIATDLWQYQGWREVVLNHNDEEED